MRRHHFKFCLVILNLLAFNAYAFAATLPQMNRPFPSPSQELSQVGCRHMATQNSHPTESAVAMAAQDRNHAMPCCKHMHDSHSGQNDVCGCKIGTCGTVQLIAIASSFLQIDVHSSSKVDAMSTVAPVTQRGQRLLRPPIR